MALALWLLAAALPSQAAELDDPTRPSHYSATAETAAEQGPAALVLNSTLISPARRLAVINGRTLGRGEMIGDARVIDIQPDRVYLERAGARVTLRLLAADIKKPIQHRANGR
jgi:hypothetical protein